MKLMYLLAFLVLTFVSVVPAFPAYGALAGLPVEERDIIIASLRARQAGPAPGPLNDTSAKLVNDEDHQWEPLRPTDIRGPCPGLNTLASHGWLPRDGIATPAQIVKAVQEAFLVDGNLITNLLSIGGKSSKSGPDPPKPAMLVGDAFFGDNHSFNETLFDEFSDFSNRYGGGNYDVTVAGEYRLQRVQESIATNPQFSFVSPRYFTAYVESVFPFLFFVDGRVANGKLDLTTAHGFFQNNSMPDGFFRPNRSIGLTEIGDPVQTVLEVHSIQPGKNEGGVNNFVFDPTSASFSGDGCLLYTNFVNQTVRSLYPNPTGALRDALNFNLNIFHLPVSNCPQIFPFGQ